MVLKVVLYCLLGGVAFMAPAMGAGHASWWWASGVVMTAAFVPVALFGPTSARGQFGVIVPVLLVVSVLTEWSEALIFVKSPLIQEHAIRNLIFDSVGHLIAAVALVVLWRILKLTHQSTEPVFRWTLPKAAAMVVLCALAYLIYYLVFGGLTYQLFTKKYYPDVTAAVAALGLWFWGIQFASRAADDAGRRSRNLHPAAGTVADGDLCGTAAVGRRRSCTAARAQCAHDRRTAFRPYR